jgi:hypothetical protein
MFGRCDSASEMGTWDADERLVQPTGGSVELGDVLIARYRTVKGIPMEPNSGVKPW